MDKIKEMQLDDKLQLLLKEKIKSHPKLEPIIANRIALELGLKSRSTLSTEKRKKWIKNAKEEQFKVHGLSIDGKLKKRDKDLQIEKLNMEIKQLKLERNNLIEKMAEIINGAHAHGLNVEKIMLPII